MQRFMRENGLFDIHKVLNGDTADGKDKTFKSGSKQIDAVLATEEVLESLQDSLILDFKDIVDSDHRGFLFDLDVCQYFSVEASDYDTTDNVTLNPAKRSHRRKFLEKVDEYIDQLNLLETVTEKCNRSITGQELERIDETISFILDSV